MMHTMPNDGAKYLVCMSAGRCKHSSDSDTFFGLILLCRGKGDFVEKSYSCLNLSKFEKCVFFKCNLPIP